VGQADNRHHKHSGMRAIVCHLDPKIFLRIWTHNIPPPTAEKSHYYANNTTIVKITETILAFFVHIFNLFF
jgi:hypothetical protein